MAISARDIFLSVRVSDRATRPLRQFSAELRRMQGTSGTAAAQRQSLLARNEAIKTQQAMNKLQASAMLPGGSGFNRQLERQRANADAITKSRQRLAGIETSITRNIAGQRTNMANIAKQQRLVDAAAQMGLPAETLIGKGSSARTVAEHGQLLQGMQGRQVALQQGAVQLTRAYQMQTGQEQNLHMKSQTLIGDMNEMHNRAGQLISRNQALSGEFQKNAADIQRLNTVEQQYLKQENLIKWSQRARMVEHLGHVLTITGLAATAGFGFAAKTAADFSSQAILAATQARPPGARPQATAQIAQKLNKIILDQMQKFPASADEMAKSLYSIFSGTNIQNIGKAGKLLRIFNQEAVAGGTDLDTMTQAGITLFNNFPNQFKNTTAAADRFFAMVRYGRGTAKQFADALSPILPIAKQAGQNFNDVAGTLAFLSRQSKDVTQNAQGFARLLILLARPEVRQGFKRIGIDVTDAKGRIRPLLDIVTELQKKVKLTPVEALTFFKTISQQATGRGTAGTIQAQRVWARLVEGVKEYRLVSGQVVKDNNEFQASFAALSKAPGVRWKIFTNQLKALVILIGEQAIPAFAAMGAKIADGIKWFRQLSPHTQHLIGYFGAFAAVATLVGGILLTVIGGFASLVITVRLLLGNRGLAGLASEAGAVQVRFALMLGAVGALIYLLIKFPGVFHTITNAVGGLSNALALLFGALAAKSILTRSGMFAAMGLQAAEATTFVNALRLSVLRLGVAASAGIAITLIVDKQARVGLENWISKHIGNQLSVTPFGLPFPTHRKEPGMPGVGHGPGGRALTAEEWFGIPKNARHGFENVLRGQTESLGKYRKAVALVQAAQTFGAPKITPSFQKLFEALIRAKKLANEAKAAMQLHPNPANIKAYFDAVTNVNKALSNLQANASKDQLAAAKTTAAGLNSIQQKQISAQKSNLKTAVDNVSQMYKDLLSQNQQALGTLFQGPFLTSPAQQAMREWGVKATRKSLLIDIQDQNLQFRRFQGALNTLSRRGAPAQLIQQLQQLGPSALPNIRLLTKMSGQQWREYITAFKNGQNLVKQQTMRDLKTQLGLYRSFGKSIGSQIIRGIKDESAPMKSQIQSLVLKMFPELRVGGRTPASQRGTSTTTHHHTHYHDHDHTKVDVTKGEDVGTALRKKKFEHRNRPRSPRIRR